MPTLFCNNAQGKICNIKVGAEAPQGGSYDEIVSMLVGCGAVLKNRPEVSQALAAVYILFGVIQDGGGLGYTGGGHPVPVDPLKGLTVTKQQLLTQLAVAELARGIRDYPTAREIEALSLRGVEAAARKLIARNAALPKELGPAISKPPKTREDGTFPRHRASFSLTT